jgi:dCTP deaminase
MILSDREIQAVMLRGSLAITPPPPPQAYSSTSLDLTLDAQIRLWDRAAAGVKMRICPADSAFSFTEVANRYSKEITMPADGYEVAPGSFLLGWTRERIQLPHRSRIAARVEGKSSLARLGLGVHVTAPTIHAGFGYNPTKLGAGLPIQLEIFNLGPLAIELKPGMAICQLIFEEVHGTPEKGYEGMFARQGPQSG